TRAGRYSVSAALGPKNSGNKIAWRPPARAKFNKDGSSSSAGWPLSSRGSTPLECRRETARTGTGNADANCCANSRRLKVAAARSEPLSNKKQVGGSELDTAAVK